MNTTPKERIQVHTRLAQLGFSFSDACRLRRDAMTLRNWFEQECGNSNDHCSWAIERNEDEADAKPFRVVHWYQGPLKNTVQRIPIADREKGARTRLAKLMADFPELTYYVQTDPRGASLYVLKRSDVNGCEIDQVYNRGVAVY